jgi:Terminase large subunit, T4likevirus-type, N-terminal
MHTTDTILENEYSRAVARARAKEREMRVGWTPPAEKNYCPHTPHDRQAVFLSLINEREVFFGGAAGGGKSDALLMAALQFVHVPDYAGIIFRRTYANLSKPGALMDRSLSWLKPTDARWNEQKKLWTFPSGARIGFGHMDSENDKYNYQSAEFQFVGFDELTEFTQSQYEFMFSRLRRIEGSDTPLRMRSASNPPQEPGGEWVQQYFVPDDFFFDDEDNPIVYKEHTNEDGVTKTRIFVPSRLEHNPSVDQDEYDESLSYLDAVTRHKLRLGDWRVKKRGEILWMYSDEHVCISWGQFAAVIGSRNIPAHWQKRVYMDAGTTQGHPNVTTFFATAGKNAPTVNGIDLSGIAFVYRGHMTYQSTTDEIATVIWDAITPTNEFDQIDDWQMSHEASSERMDYQKRGLPFRNWETGRTRGIPQLQNAFALRETKLPHPFRPELLGHPKLMFIVDDDQLDFPKNDLGLARWRAEAPAYKYAKPKSGEEAAVLLPHPLFNDAMDTCRAGAVDYFPDLAPLTHEEEVEARMSVHLKREAVAEYYGKQGFPEMMVARIQEQRQVEMKIEEEKKEDQLHIRSAMSGGSRVRLLGNRRRKS